MHQYLGFFFNSHQRPRYSCVDWSARGLEDFTSHNGFMKLNECRWYKSVAWLVSGVESNRTSVSQKCFDGVSGWSGFLQTAAGNLTLTFTSTFSHCALWGRRAPLRWVRGQRNETPCQRDFSLMRYFDKVNYIQPAHNGGKTRGGTGHSLGSVHAAVHYIESGLVCSVEMKYTAEATGLMQSKIHWWNDLCSRMCLF